MLHLPDVAELVGDEIVTCPTDRLPQRDQVPGGVAVEAPEPRQGEEEGPDDDANTVDSDRSRIEIEPVEASFGPLEGKARGAPAIQGSIGESRRYALLPADCWKS
jgi:hypothetical protein